MTSSFDMNLKPERRHYYAESIEVQDDLTLLEQLRYRRLPRHSSPHNNQLCIKHRLQGPRRLPRRPRRHHRDCRSHGASFHHPPYPGTQWESARIQETQHSGKENKIKNVTPVPHCLLSRVQSLHVHRFMMISIKKASRRAQTEIAIKN